MRLSPRLHSSLATACLFLAACSPNVVENAVETAAAAAGPELTIERVIGSPSITGPSVRSVKMSPDGARVSFLRGKTEDQEQLDLWEYNIADGETRLLVDSNELLGGQAEVLSEAEKARRERQRISNSGIISYSWNEEGTALLFPLAGDVYMKVLGGDVKRLTKTESYETDIKFSPKSRYVSFIRGRDLFVVDVATGQEARLTVGATDVIANGVAEFVAQEELNRFTGYWWSPDETRIAFTRIDESPVSVLNRYEMTEDGGVTTLEQRYPSAGTDNALIELGVVTVASKAVSWVDLGEDTDIYLARVNWLADSSKVSFQRMPRDQQSLDLVAADVDGSGGLQTLITETSDVWINLHKDVHFLEESEQFVWASERSGYKHLYLYANDGTELGALTTGRWVVKKIVQVDEVAGKVYFTGFKDSTVEQHLYVAALQPDPASITRITSQSGWHGATMGDDTSTYLDTFSNVDTPSQIALRKVDDDSLVTYINENPLDESHPYFEYKAGHAKSQFSQLTAADGISKLDYRLILPPNMLAGHKYPAILAPYGGPHGHRVKNSFDVDQNQILARNGFVVLIVDNRGSDDRGLAFEAGIKNAMGTVEIEDQITAATFLQTLDYVDAERIGFHGWSYGGYMTLMMMAKSPELIKVGVAGAPVTDWRLYDTAYTERYLGHPDAPGDVYENSSVFKHVAGMKGKLMLIHGMADDNVFFDNSVKLMAVLQKEGVPFDLMTYPGQKHGFKGDAVRIHVAKLRLDYFLEHL